MELNFCPTCNQMTNHGVGTNGGCLKCRGTQPSPSNKGGDQQLKYKDMTSKNEEIDTLMASFCLEGKITEQHAHEIKALLTKTKS